MTFVQISDEMCAAYSFHSAIGIFICDLGEGSSKIKLPSFGSKVFKLNPIFEIPTAHTRVITDPAVIREYTLKVLFGEF